MKTETINLSGSCKFTLTTYENIDHKDVYLEYTEHSTDHWHSDTETSIDLDAENAKDIIAFLQKAFPELAPVQEPADWKYRLVKIHDALGAHLGDTDPYIPEDMNDEEVCEYEPVFWAAKKIAELIGDGPWDKYTTTRPSGEQK